jgi:hypothetical protein
MNLRYKSAATTGRSNADPMIATSPPGRWLFLARVAWVIITLLILVLNIVAMPYYDAVLKTICAAPVNCFSDQLAASDLQGLHALGVSLGVYATLTMAVNALFALIWVALGALIFWRRSDEPMALFCAFMLVMFGGGFTNMLLEGLAPLSLGWYALVYFLYFLAQVSFYFFFYLFPTGRFVPRWTRWVALFIVGYVTWDFIFGSPGQIISPLDALAFFGLLLTAVLTQVYRYRRVSTPSQRQQTKWVVFAFAFVIVGFLISISAAHFFIPTDHSSFNFIGGALLNALFLLIPCSIAIAILRSRLWDIDIIINKTLVYGSLTTLLAAVYAGLIIGLESLVGLFTRQTAQPLVIVISTLAIAALFQPLRKRIQRVIDRLLHKVREMHVRGSIITQR